MVLFTSLRNREVMDKAGDRIGKLVDLVFLDGKEFAEITHAIIKDERGYRKKVSWSLAKEIIEQKRRQTMRIHLSVKSDDTNPLFENSKDFLISELLDKQIVDIDGLKVVRVNDIVLSKKEGKFVAAGVAVGTRSFLRRLGLLRFVNSDKIKERVIPWNSVESIGDKLHNLHIKMERSKIADLHPWDIADIMEDLSHKERVLVFSSVSEQKAAEILLEAEPEVQQSMFKNLKKNRIIEILERVQPDDAADILAEMKSNKAKQLLRAMNNTKAKKIREILKYPEDTAGAIMQPDIITVSHTHSASQVIRYLRKIKPTAEKTFYLYVVDRQRHLMGILSLRSLVIASPKEKVVDIMRPDIVKIQVTTPREEIASSFSKYDLFVLPVVDHNNVLKGVVEADDVIDEVIPEEWKRKTIKHKHKVKHGSQKKR